MGTFSARVSHWFATGKNYLDGTTQATFVATCPGVG